MKATQHALSQMRVRCGIDMDPKTLLGRLQSALKLYVGPNGDYRMIRLNRRVAVLVVRAGTVVTALSVQHAFSNCPKGTFYSLIVAGYLQLAVSLRMQLIRGELPSPHGTDDSNYKYPKTKARVLWDSFCFLARGKHRHANL